MGKWLKNLEKKIPPVHILWDYCGTLFSAQWAKVPSRQKPWVVAKQLWSFPRHVPYRESKLPLSSRAGLGRTEDPKNRDFPWFCRAFLVPFPWWNIAKQVDMTSRDGICWPRWLCQGLPFYNMLSVAKASWSCWHAWPLLTSTMRRDSAQSNQRKVREVQAIYAQVRSLWEDSFRSGVVALFWFGIVHSDPLPQLPVQWDFSWVHDAILAWVFWAWELNWDVFVYKMPHRLFATRTIWARCNMLPRRIWTGSGWIRPLWCIGWLACRYHDVIMKRDAVRSSWWGRADSRWAGDQSRPQGIVRASVCVHIFPDRLSIDQDFCEASMMDFAVWILWILCSFLGRFRGVAQNVHFLGTGPLDRRADTAATCGAWLHPPTDGAQGPWFCPSQVHMVQKYGNNYGQEQSSWWCPEHENCHAILGQFHLRMLDTHSHSLQHVFSVTFSKRVSDIMEGYSGAEFAAFQPGIDIAIASYSFCEYRVDSKATLLLDNIELDVPFIDFKSFNRRQCVFVSTRSCQKSSSRFPAPKCPGERCVTCRVGLSI